MEFNFEKKPHEIRQESIYVPFYNFIGNKERRQQFNETIKVLQAPTALGKTFAIFNQFIPTLFSEDFEQEINLVVIAVPHLENVDTPAFQKAARDHGYIYTENISDVEIHLNNGEKVVFAATHAKILISVGNILLKYSDKSAWFIDECHSWLGVTDIEWYQEVIGWSTPKFNAAIFKYLSDILKSTDLVFGITATPTKQHRKLVGPIEFEIINEWPPVSERGLLTKPSAGYEMYDGYTEDYETDGRGKRKKVIRINKHNAFSALEDYIETRHIKCMKNNEELQKYDPNVNVKLTTMISCGGANSTRLAIPLDEVLDFMTELLERNDYNPAGYWIAIMRDSQKGFCNLLGDFVPAKEDEVIADLNDPNKDVQYLLVNQKGKAGINVRNMTGVAILKVRDPKTADVTEIARQQIGRATRINTGHGDILKERYDFNLKLMCENYPKDYGVDPWVFYETLINNNSFKLCFPSTPKDHWETAVKEFSSDYTANLEDLIPHLKTFIFGNDSEILPCPNCGTDLSNFVKLRVNAAYEKGFDDGRQTLKPFFEDAAD
tara:strand:- start:230 stop:1876 length:1647 start_codon:yes stop_codon:yes gene_type:complete